MRGIQVERRHYEQLRDRGLDALRRGELREAARELEAARESVLAADEPDRDLIDQAEVNLAMVRVQLHEDDEAERGLREVLLRTTNEDVVRLASHCLAKVLSHRQDHERALRHAARSLEAARSIGEPLKIHGALTLLGAIRLNQCYLDESLAHYEEALAILEANPLDDVAQHGFYLAMVTDNVGYVLVLMGRSREGQLHLESALERATALGLTDLVAEAGSDLCFAHLQEGELDLAERHGLRALEIAERQDLPFFRRNCYYLLGEIASRRGDEPEADRWFRKLGEFYPQVAMLGEFLKEYDVSQLVNLKEFA